MPSYAVSGSGSQSGIGVWTYLDDMTITFSLQQATDVAVWLRATLGEYYTTNVMQIGVRLDEAGAWLGPVSAQVPAGSSMIAASTCYLLPQLAAGGHSVRGGWIGQTTGTAAYRHMLVQYVPSVDPSQVTWNAGTGRFEQATANPAVQWRATPPAGFESGGSNPAVRFADGSFATGG